jgi:hypothetical protein
MIPTSRETSSREEGKEIFWDEKKRAIISSDTADGPSSVAQWKHPALVVAVLLFRDP